LCNASQNSPCHGIYWWRVIDVYIIVFTYSEDAFDLLIPFTLSKKGMWYLHCYVSSWPGCRLMSVEEERAQDTVGYHAAVSAEARAAFLSGAVTATTTEAAADAKNAEGDHSAEVYDDSDGESDS
jgi:hypothetical protein